MLIFINGNIGAGKSTIMEKIRQIRPNIKIYCEVLDLGLLAKYYENPKMYAFEFQFQYLYHKALNIVQLDPDKNIIIVERGFYSDASFAELHHAKGNISDDEYKIYLKLYKQMTDFISSIKQIHINICTNAETCHQRIKQRGRGNETDKITMEYLKEVAAINEKNLPKDCKKVPSNDIDTVIQLIK